MRAVNLIPADDRRGVAGGVGRSGGAAYIVLGAAFLIAVLVGLYGLARHEVSDRKSKLASLAVETQRAQESVSALSPYTSFAALREQRMKAVEQVVDSRFDWAHAFHELGRVLPRDASISSLEGSVGGTTAGSSTTSAPAASAASAGTSASAGGASSATPPGSVPTMTLAGCASSQSEVALTLQRLRLMDGVSTVSLQSSAKTSSTGSGSTGSGGGNCTPQSASFTVQITFEPLPTPAASSGSGTELTAATGGNR
jgi:Tfp pilus assembly protein PilN